MLNTVQTLQFITYIILESIGGVFQVAFTGAVWCDGTQRAKCRSCVLRTKDAVKSLLQHW